MKIINNSIEILVSKLKTQGWVLVFNIII